MPFFSLTVLPNSINLSWFIRYFLPHLCVDPASVVAAEVGGEVGDLLDLSHPAGGVHLDGVLHHLPRGVEAREGALRLDGARRDAVHADALAAPLHPK